MNKDCAIDHVKEKEEEEDSDDEETDDEEFMSYLTEMFVRLLGELKDSNKNEQKQIIEEVNGILDEMERKELESVLSDELSNKIHKMIKEKKLSMENAILLLKHIGYLKTLKRINIYDFEKISLGERIDKMNAEEEEKKEEKNKKLLADLCECYLLLTYRPSYEFISASCILCILKVASRKDETEEVQKDVEIALLALRYISQYFKVPEELYLNEIREIIKYHQKHHNLTSLAYQSAWQFLVNRMVYDNSPVEVIANELHFAREAISELEELTKCIDWKKNGDQMKEMEEENLLEKWITTLNIYFRGCEIRKKEHVVLIESIIQMLRAAKDYCSGISEKCIELLITVSYNTSVEIEDLLKCGAVEEGE
eukprot:MONOS_4874.1-p1 / transcript=MONOS_4874.1 / gene=MONOS_4874 / organism=Monocercomonoides_exilis_PA203 / gene_product=unspecified product / transcript_product=unspecified product / location=Mono_scaffold00136:26190-27506(-) / protein_length=368 / sequence_SO=supercontig / SO=protein_coding / is_pseudo=false